MRYRSTNGAYRIRSDKILCIHGNSSKCEKCLRLKNNGIAKEKNNKMINDEMLCIHEMLLISSYYSTQKNHSDLLNGIRKVKKLFIV